MLAMGAPHCKVNDSECTPGAKVSARGLCRAHYGRLRASADFQPTEPPAEPGEVWLPIPGYVGLYEVSNLHNRVWSVARIEAQGKRVGGRLLKPHIETGSGYSCVALHCDGDQRTWKVHQLVALAHLDEPSPGQEVCHGDLRRGDGSYDNSAANLSYGTREKNNGEDKDRDGTHNRGERCGAAVLREEAIPAIRRRAADGETHRALAEEYGVSRQAIGHVVARETWRHVP